MYIFKSRSNNNLKNINNYYFANNSSLSGTVVAPGDKSISQRALIISLICVGTTIIEDILDSEDVYHTLKAIQLLGARVKIYNNYLKVNGVGVGNFISPKKPIYMGNSGTGTRLLLGLVAGSNALVTFFGDESLTDRPMERVLTPLEEMGAKIICSKNKKLPITIIGARKKGFVLPINYKLVIPSAQIKSAILLAALSARGTSFITEFKKTRNYTENMLKKRGVSLKQKKINKKKTIISLDGTPFIKSKDVKIPGDPSSAAFLAVAALITKNSKIHIENVLNDKFRLSVFKVLEKMGAKIKIKKLSSDICKILVESSKLKGINIKSNLSAALIDEYPILSIAAACAEGETRMEGLGELRFKESDRLNAIVVGLNKCGVTVKSHKDNIIINGMKEISGGCYIEPENDHRIAMSFNILNLVTKYPIKVKDNKSVVTSFPNFFDSFRSIGVNLLKYDHKKKD